MFKKIAIVFIMVLMIISINPFGSANAEHTEYDEIDWMYTDKISVYEPNNSPGVYNETKIMQWDASSHYMKFFVDNNTDISRIEVIVIENGTYTTSANPGDSVSILITLISDNTYIEYHSVAPYHIVTYPLRDDQPQIYALYYSIPINYHIAESGVYHFNYYLYIDHDGQTDDTLEWYNLAFEVRSVLSYVAFWSYGLPLIFVLMIAGGLSILSGRISLMLFLVTFGIGFTLMIFVSIFPWWSVIIPIILLVSLLFLHGSDDE